MSLNNTNNTILVGIIVSEKTFSHEMYGEIFYNFNVEVKRLSDEKDIIPVTASEVLIDSRFGIGTKILVKGQFRSYNTTEEEKNKLKLTIFAKDIFYNEEVDEQIKENKEQTLNQVNLIGYICKKPIYRETPKGREITDLLLAVNRAYNKSDYIPAITWGRMARMCKKFEVGTEVSVTGRFQSREYEKKCDNGKTEIKTAYELSVMLIEENVRKEV
ncbi:MAG: single-stranded DNA-binding protein [Clostridia bacterium]|jgi:primosomal replication protein N|nr:single-stranded DNA-binding protein [Clostridia bacterium]